MGRYNLITEQWLNIIDEQDEFKQVSLIELFENAHRYQRLAGETSAQDFATMRLLLAILQTTFTRYDADGDAQIEPSKKELQKEWKQLWQQKKFPINVLEKYLTEYENRFNLYDETFPFMQVTEADLEAKDITKTGKISGKLINRLLSESNNKSELFAPTADEYKNQLTDDQLARWLIAFQGYTGTGDKAKYPKMKGSASKGWLLGLGGIYLQGDNLFETLMLNLIFNKASKQTPIWELNFDEKIEALINPQPTNLAALYTNCSRLLVIDPTTDLNKSEVVVQAVQLPGMSLKDNLIEPMTLWQVPKSGDNKGELIPQPHRENQALWRSFGSFSSTKDDIHLPDIIIWSKDLVEDELVDASMIKVVSTGLTYNHDASNMPNGEIYDELSIYNEILVDFKDKDNWVNRIEGEVDKTQKAIYFLNLFAKDIMRIRNTENDNLSDIVTKEAYYAVDLPFKEWIAGLTPDSKKEASVKQWNQFLKKLLIEQADELVNSHSHRDLIGIIDEKTNSVINIMTQYNFFRYRLNKLMEES